MHLGDHRADVGIIHLQIHGPDHVVDIGCQQAVFFLAGTQRPFGGNPLVDFPLQRLVGVHQLGRALFDTILQNMLGP